MGNCNKVRGCLKESIKTIEAGKGYVSDYGNRYGQSQVGHCLPKNVMAGGNPFAAGEFHCLAEAERVVLDAQGSLSAEPHGVAGSVQASAQEVLQGATLHTKQ